VRVNYLLEFLSVQNRYIGRRAVRLPYAILSFSLRTDQVGSQQPAFLDVRIVGNVCNRQVVCARSREALPASELLTNPQENTQKEI
jgi:hypothetical protein